MTDTALDTSQYPSMLFGGDYRPPPSPDNLSTPPLPAQGDQPPAAEPPRAFEPGWRPPVEQAQAPTPGVSPPQQQPAFDDQQEANTASQAEEALYGSKVLEHRTGKELKPAKQLTLDDFPVEKEKLTALHETIKEIIREKPDQKTVGYWSKQAADLQKVIDARIAAANKAEERRYQQQQKDFVRQQDVPFMSPESRLKQLGVLSTTGSEMLGDLEAEKQSSTPKEAQNAEYMYRVSPWNTMNTGKPGAPRYDTLYNVATNISLVNRHLQDPNLVMQYVMKMGMPIDIRENRNAVGENGFRGSGGTNYIVEGRDPRDNYLIKFRDGTRLSVDPDSKRILDRARVQGFKAAHQYFAEDKAKRDEMAKPGLVERGYQYFFPPLPKPQP
jgi:hypothetical protein